MTEDLPERRSPMAIAAEWSARMTTIGLEMALPALGGYWLDGRIGTTPVFVIIGALLGVAVGMLHLIQMVRQQEPPRPL